MPRYTFNPDSFEVSTPVAVPLLGDHQAILGLSQVYLATDLEYRVHVVKSGIDGCRITGEGAADARELVKRIETSTSASIDGYECSIVDTGIHHSRLDYHIAESVCWSAIFAASTGTYDLESSLAVSQAAFKLAAAPAHQQGAWAATEIGGLVSLNDLEGECVSYDIPLNGFILANTSAAPERNSAKATEEAEGAIAELRTRIPDLCFRSVDCDQVYASLADISEHRATLCFAHLVLRDLCLRSMEMFGAKDIEPFEFARLLDEQENMRRDYLGLTSPNMTRLAERALKAGALASTGFGDDGSMIIYAPRNQRPVSQTVESDGYVAVAVGKGRGLTFSDIPQRLS